MALPVAIFFSLDHRRLDDRQSLGARTAAAQKKTLLSLTAISKRIEENPVCDIRWFFLPLTSFFVPHS